jgi:hypothetical protein
VVRVLVPVRLLRGVLGTLGLSLLPYGHLYFHTCFRCVFFTREHEQLSPS